MSELKLSYSGYVCAPYLHSHESIELRDSWLKSKNIERLYFVTGTFSSESKPYFSDSSNHYLLAKFKDSSKIADDLTEYNQEKTSFVFNMKDDLFQHEVIGKVNFISAYYLEYDDNEDISEIASLLVKKDQIEYAGAGNMETFCKNPAKFTFPYAENIIVIEVASEKSHQSVKKYCEQTRRDANRKGLSMTNLISLSLLEQIK